MSRGKRLLLAFLLVGSAAGFATHHVAVRQRQALERERVALARLEEERIRAQHALETTRAQLAQVERETAAARAAVAARESSPPHLWASRVMLMRQLLAEMPAQKIPELKLLGLLDWIQVARTAELDTPNRIRSAFAALRSLARRRMADLLRPALRAFTDASGGELPADVRQLAPHLPPAVDAAMLERYEMIRRGRIGATNEHLIREKPTSDAILLVSLDGFEISTNSELIGPAVESADEAKERFSAALQGAGDSDASSALLGTLAPFFEILPEIAKKYESKLSAYADVDSLFKQVGARFHAAHPDVVETHLGELLPYLPDPQMLANLVKAGFAELEYFHAHNQLAPNEAALAPFLQRPFDAKTALRAVKIKFDGERFSMNFGWSTSEKSTGFFTRDGPDTAKP